MKKLLPSLMAFAVLASANIPAVSVAAPPTGSNVQRGEEGLTGRFNPRNETSPRPGINAYFRCIASLHRARANKLVALEYLSAEQRGQIEKVGPASMFEQDRRENCFNSFSGDGGVQIQYDPVSAIGAFAEYFTLKEFEENDAERIAALTREDWQTADLTPRNGSEMIGLCTAQAAGPAVYRLVATEPASDEEAAAIQAVVPYLGPCLTDGVEVSFDATSLRALLAHSLYKALTGMEALEKAKS